MSKRNEKRLAIFGLGGVGTALLELLAERRPALRLTGIADSRGVLAGDLNPRDDARGQACWIVAY